MSTNLDLCRDILKALEAGPQSRITDSDALPGRHCDDIRAQLDLLVQAGLVRHEKDNADDASRASAIALTANGREFLRLAKNDAMWKRSRAELASAHAEVSLAMVRARLLEWGQFS